MPQMRMPPGQGQFPEAQGAQMQGAPQGQPQPALGDLDPEMLMQLLQMLMAQGGGAEMQNPDAGGAGSDIPPMR